jgi:hypothetical protein
MVAHEEVELRSRFQLSRELDPVDLSPFRNSQQDLRLSLRA